MFGGPYPLTVVDWQSYFGLPNSRCELFHGHLARVGCSPKGRAAPIKHYLDVLNHYGADSFDDCFRYYVNFAPAGMIMALIASMIVGETERGNDIFMVMAKGSIAYALTTSGARAEGSSPDSAMKIGVRVSCAGPRPLINVPSGKHVADNGAVIRDVRLFSIKVFESCARVALWSR